MSATGTYCLIAGRLQKVSDAVPSLTRPIYFNKGGHKYFDASARQTFASKAEKRQWLTQHGMREGGVIDKNIDHLGGGNTNRFRNRSGAEDRG